MSERVSDEALRTIAETGCGYSDELEAIARELLDARAELARLRAQVAAADRLAAPCVFQPPPRDPDEGDDIVSVCLICGDSSDDEEVPERHTDECELAAYRAARGAP